MSEPMPVWVEETLRITGWEARAKHVINVLRHGEACVDESFIKWADETDNAADALEVADLCLWSTLVHNQPQAKQLEALCDRLKTKIERKWQRAQPKVIA